MTGIVRLPQSAVVGSMKTSSGVPKKSGHGGFKRYISGSNRVDLNHIGSIGDTDFLRTLNRRMKELWGHWGSIHFN